MLRLMRKHARSWGMIMMLGIIIIVFIFYFGYSRNQSQANIMATLDGKVISYTDYRREYDNLLDLYRNQLGRNFSEEIIKLLNLKEKAFDKLLSQAIMLAKAEELDLRVDDEELKSSIMSYPAFQRDGSFDQHVYEGTLRLNKLTPEDFETRQRQMLLATKLQNLITAGIHVSDEEIFDLYRLQNEKINVSYLKLSSINYRDKVNPNQQALEPFYKEHSKDFRLPEQLQVKYVVFNAVDYASSINIAEDDVRDYYERNKQRYAQPGGTVPTLEELKVKITIELQRVAGMARAAAEAKQAHDTIYQQENFDAFTAGRGLKVLTSPFFPVNNVPPELRTLPDFAKNVLPLQANELSRVMSDDKGYYLFQIAAKKPSYIPAFKEVQGQVEIRYAEKEAEILCQREAADILERLKKGEPWEKIAKAKNISVSETGFILPSSGLPELGFSEQAESALAQLSEAKPYPDKVLAGSGNFVIVRFKERSKPDEADFQTRKEELKKTLKELKRNETVNSWLEGFKLTLIKEGRLKIIKDAFI